MQLPHVDKWDARWWDMAGHVQQWSKDPSTKVGCVIVGTANQVLATGYNGFPRGVSDYVTNRYERPGKYLWTEHAERNTIYNAARTGTSLVGGTLYVRSSPSLAPCADCARGIIQTGIVTVNCQRPDFSHPQWGEQTRVAFTMFEEAGVRANYTERP